MCMSVYMYVCLCICVYLCMCVCLCMYVCVCVCMYVCMCVCVYVYMHVCGSSECQQVAHCVMQVYIRNKCVLLETTTPYRLTLLHIPQNAALQPLQPDH